MQADSLTDLLLNKVIAVATDLKIILDSLIDSNDRIADLHHWESCLWADPRVHVKLVED